MSRSRGEAPAREEEEVPALHSAPPADVHDDATRVGDLSELTRDELLRAFVGDEAADASERSRHETPTIPAPASAPAEEPASPPAVTVREGPGWLVAGVLLGAAIVIALTFLRT
jgi:hypothetical protein